MPPQNNQTKTLQIAALILVPLLIIGVVIFIMTHKTGSGSSPQSQLPSATPPQEVINLAKTYAAARENAVGADQSSPTSWLNIIRPLSTAAWFSSLQPAPNTPTGGGLAEYNLAHNNGYVVKVSVGDCNWSFKTTIPTDTQGAVTCILNDATLATSTHSQIANASLPFGWSHNGPQTPITLLVVRQKGKWLVNNDISYAD